MFESVDFSRYKLLYKEGKGVREGALLRFQFENNNFGFADCHPWPEIGDVPLNEQLSLLKKRQLSTKNLKRALAIAKNDAQARSKNLNLFDGLSVPVSHYLIMSINCLSTELLENISEEGFSTVKVKVGRNIDCELDTLKKQLKADIARQFSFRFDFNEILTAEEFQKYLKTLLKMGVHIDFCEDPFPFDQKKWIEIECEYDVRLALDKKIEQLNHDDKEPALIVIKPAVDDMEMLKNLQEKTKVVVTSYLDHPIGQTAAAYVGALINKEHPDRLEVCGLLSHRVYQENIFSERMTPKGSLFPLTQGTGLGFNSLLENQQWEKI